MARVAVSGPPRPRLSQRIPPPRATILAAFVPPAPAADDATVFLTGLLATFAPPRARDVNDRPEDVHPAPAPAFAAADITTRVSRPRTAIGASRPVTERARTSQIDPLGPARPDERPSASRCRAGRAKGFFVVSNNISTSLTLEISIVTHEKPSRMVLKFMDARRD
jgi:hypothetical protein